MVEQNSFLEESAYIYTNLAGPVQRRVRALKVLMNDEVSLRIERDKEFFEISKKYESKQNSLFEKRRQIVEGAYEPTEEESIWTNSFDSVEVSKNGDSNGESPNGIPEFWLSVLRNSEIFDFLTEEDEKVLKSLVDIRVVSEDIEDNEAHWRIIFEFSQNDYFTNDQLTLSVVDKFSTGEGDERIDYEAPRSFKLTGCQIDWKPGMSLTEKKVQVTQRRKNKQPITTTKVKPTYSMFTIFNPALLYGHDTVEDPKADLARMMFEDAVDLCNTLKDYVVPQAVLYFLKQNACEESEDEDDQPVECSDICSDEESD